MIPEVPIVLGKVKIVASTSRPLGRFLWFRKSPDCLGKVKIASSASRPLDSYGSRSPRFAWESENDCFSFSASRFLQFQILDNN